MEDPPLVIDVDYLAPVPAGTEVSILSLSRPDAGFFGASEVSCVIDRGHRIVYGDLTLWELLTSSTSSTLPCDDVAAALGPSWVVARHVEGRVSCAVVTTRGEGKFNHIRTRLYVMLMKEPAYRT
jgi:hypothetical protein